MVKITTASPDKVDLTDGVLVVGVTEDEGIRNFFVKDSRLSHIIKQIDSFGQERLNNIKKYGKSMTLGLNLDNSPIMILLIGLGESGKLDSDRIRHIGGLISLRCKELNYEKINVLKFFSESGLTESFVEGLVLAQYEFNNFKEQGSETEQKQSFFEKCTINMITGESQLETDQIQINKTLVVCEAVFFSRDLANSPPNYINPDALAAHAKSLESIDNIDVQIFDQDQIKQMGMNGIISVGKGSQNEPKLIVVNYNNSKSNEKPILLIGKAVTFDTGGISIKPSDRMDEMKFDKSGGCTVLGIMKAVGNLALPINVIAIIPAVENMPSGSSYRPGDIIRMYNGKTVEVLNTDAEGRMILADALAFGISKYSPKYVVDFATLTGACIIALGTNVAGIIGNNDKLIHGLISASKTTGEKIWQLPLFEEYFDLIKSNVASIKNIGGRTGGTITAAAFLSKFVDSVPWAHFDIAGTAWTQDGTAERSYNPKGATGFGIRLLLNYLQNNNDF
ncbi:leucyl aminopeptidase [Candidatus Nitrosocosmicus franklandus]|uniref:Probable cytosol aminopeptidase n=1 Tax=Candidatus Nitrosocosmicus franklandianus TaxID=1798806 RepID=A0A484IBG5_9ARCH|nr:leucyl aminopeptidase [Candidatus Nitrosocosmicus franklandus]VFJ15094.1 putative cytosol aminopeptidase [Candidatus Nitrosocosmicus franklandus]